VTRPTPDELAEAIEEFLAGEVLPTLADPRLRFRLLRRELAALPGHDDPQLRELATRIRAGDIAPGTLARVKALAAERLAVDSPRYLDRY